MIWSLNLPNPNPDQANFVFDQLMKEEFSLNLKKILKNFWLLFYRDIFREYNPKKFRVIVKVLFSKSVIFPVFIFLGLFFRVIFQKCYFPKVLFSCASSDRPATYIFGILRQFWTKPGKSWIFNFFNFLENPLLFL